MNNLWGNLCDVSHLLKAKEGSTKQAPPWGPTTLQLSPALSVYLKSI